MFPNQVSLMSNSVGDKQENCLLFVKTDLIQSLYGRTVEFIQNNAVYLL